MPFVKGNTYGKGRPKGSTSKLLQDADLKRLNKTISILLESSEEDIQKLSPNQRTSALLKFLEFKLPKLRAIEVDADVSTQDEDMLDQIALRILKNSIENGQVIKYKEPDSK